MERSFEDGSRRGDDPSAKEMRKIISETEHTPLRMTVPGRRRAARNCSSG